MSFSWHPSTPSLADQACMCVPLTLKPTFLNMSSSVISIQVMTGTVLSDCPLLGTAILYCSEICNSHWGCTCALYFLTWIIVSPRPILRPSEASHSSCFSSTLYQGDRLAFLIQCISELACKRWITIFYLLKQQVQQLSYIFRVTSLILTLGYYLCKVSVCLASRRI